MSTSPTSSSLVRPLGAGAAVALVFGSSAAVLVVEIVALRLLAPYFGLSLETSTLVIGIALTAIAFGSWSGGRIADRVDPHRMLGPALGISGAVVAVTPALLRSVAEAAPETLILVAALTILVPGALLSAVTPMVTKLRLTNLEETGTVVGRLSGIGTVGAIVGTVLTGFVLISRLPVSEILLGLGALLVLAAALVEVRLRRWAGPATAALVVVGGGLALLVAPGGCDAETKYHCANVLTDQSREGGRTLVLDGVRNSYVDLNDPTYLEFTYIRGIAAVTDVAFPGNEALTAYYLGGGGLTLPRYLDDTRPGTTGVVSEIDGGVIQIDQEQLGLGDDSDLEVRVEDGRLGLRRLDSNTRELVVGDAFSGASVPWHLTTAEAMTQVHRVLTKDGTYVVNMIDYGELAFARAHVATLRQTFDHVAVAGDPGDVDPDVQVVSTGGNLIAVASDRPLDQQALREALTERETGWTVVTGDSLTAWLDGAEVLTDDYAPVDQLLQPFS